MEKKFKDIILFFMLIVGLVIFSHSLIPHDHHYNLANDLADEQHHDDNAPIHCHFLDFATIDQSIQKVVIQKIVLQPILLAALQSFDFEERLNNSTYFILSDSKPNLLTFIATSPTRGSPSFS